jgi:hypothetical protein
LLISSSLIWLRFDILEQKVGKPLLQEEIWRTEL